MKRHSAILLALVLVLSSIFTACTDQEASPDSTALLHDEAPADVLGTHYEIAVVNLTAMGIMSTYDDGTFHPQDPLTRAEYCEILAKAMGAIEADLKEAPDNYFADLINYDWAREYINYAVKKGIIFAYDPDNELTSMFRPASTVALNEFTIMLLNALGQVPSDNSGGWYEPYMKEASALGFYESVPELTDADFSDSIKCSADITRGNTAIIIYNALDQLRAAGGNEQ